jgi:hypothetical protein
MEGACCVKPVLRCMQVCGVIAHGATASVLQLQTATTHLRALEQQLRQLPRLAKPLALQQLHDGLHPVGGRQELGAAVAGALQRGLLDAVALHQDVRAAVALLRRRWPHRRVASGQGPLVLPLCVDTGPLLSRLGEPGSPWVRDQHATRCCLWSEVSELTPVASRHFRWLCS